jgi:hypothetical protein
MTAQARKQAPSGRFIRSYYTMWGLLAAAGLTYLVSIAPQLYSRVSSQEGQRLADLEKGVRVAYQALSEIGSVQRSVGEIRRDIGRLKETVENHDAREREAQARLAALEEKVASAAVPPPVAAATPAPETAPAARQVVAKSASDKRPERRPNAHIVPVEGASQAGAAAPAPEARPGGVETGSIASPPPGVAFGPAKVSPAREQFYSVQVGAGPSLDALRLTWSILSERHGALAMLKPRYVAPRSGSGPYRLIAGRFASKAEAEKVCADMGVGRQGCLPTTSVGEPL